ncbi:uncharacterized protein LOC115735385 [Rhodamnia argentea]|uniref:Uncharacterized protein LOC115735385 n=1 Tax=Rhodamnia argentea TaxID=178133 RepID=A0A8B8NJ12_9MYRT|nr:uncharacterized protein LOC115735385 [Rhodamnia argentea]
MQSLVLLVVLMGAVVAIAWLVLNPHPPTFRLDSLSLSGLPNASDISSPPLKLHIRILLTASNPNKKLALAIQDVDLFVALFQHGHRLPLSSHNDTLPSENYISKRGHRALTVVAEAGLPPGRGRRMKRLYQFTQGSAVMLVRMKVTVKFMHGYWPSKQATVKVGCGHLTIGISPSTQTGELKEGGKDCRAGFA